jgi:hypothetical protein
MLADGPPALLLEFACRERCDVRDNRLGLVKRVLRRVSRTSSLLCRYADRVGEGCESAVRAYHRAQVVRVHLVHLGFVNIEPCKRAVGLPVECGMTVQHA